MGRRPLFSGFLCHKLHHSFSIYIGLLPIYPFTLFISDSSPFTTFTTSISPDQEACFVEVLGQARVDEIKAGDSPTATEFFEARGCI